MSTMKKFFKYFLLFVATFIIVTLLTNWSTQKVTKELRNYDILSESPKISVSKCLVSRSDGKVSGTVTNDTGELINKLYLKIDGYNSKGTKLGTNYEELVYLYPNDVCNFENSFDWDNVYKIELSLVSEK